MSSQTGQVPKNQDELIESSKEKNEIKKSLKSTA